MALLLSTYCLTELLSPFFASLLLLTAILFLGRLIPLFDVIINYGIGVADFIRLCAYMIPNLFLFAIPMASMLGVILCFTRMGNDNELIALKAAGIGVNRMLPPVILFACATSLLTGYFSTTLIPAGTSTMKQLFFHLATEKIDRGLQEKHFSEGLPGVVVYIDSLDKQQGEWRGVYVSDSRDSDNPVAITAESGRLDTDMTNRRISLQLRRGAMHSARYPTSETISFQTYMLHIPIDGTEAVASGKSGRIDKNEMTQQELLRFASTLPPDSPRVVDLLKEYHQRLVLAGGCFILTVLGLPLAIRTRPGQRSIGVPLALLIFISYYVVLTFAENFCETGVAPVALAMWAPNALFAGLTLLVLRFAGSESTVVDLLLDGIDRLLRFMRPRFKDDHDSA